MRVGYIIKEARYYRKITGFSRAIKKFLLSQTPLSKLVNTAFYNKIYYGLVKSKSDKVEPSILQIENTNLCNAKCVMCPHTIMKRKRKIMKQKDFEKIVDNVIGGYCIKRITITGFGEPFIDKELVKKINYLNKNYPQLKIDLYTNASALTKKRTDELLKTRVDRITFSINGTKKNYKKIMGLNYDSTEKNVLYFMKKKAELKNPILTNLSLMILKENEKDVNEFVKFWSPLSDSVRVYAPSNWAGNVDIIQTTPFKNNKQWPCGVLWTNITVDVDGNVIMCCRDYESRVKFGNLIKEDIKKIRNSDKFTKLLQKQLNFDFKTPVCITCDNSSDSSIEWWL